MATIPKLALIPSGYKAGKVYSVLPTDGSGDLDFARTTTATRINKNGLIENVGNNVPRLDYEGGGCPSLLLEPTSRNLITQSESFGNSYWTKSGATIEGDASTAGAEKVVNGDFATDTDWNKNSNWTISGGVAHADGTANGNINQGDDNTVIGATFIVTYDITSYTSGTFYPQYGGVALTPRSAVGTYTEQVTTISNLRLSFRGALPLGSIDNLSVKEVQGFSAPSVDSPLGAFKLVEDTSNGLHWIESNSRSSVAGDLSLSIRVKADGISKIGIRESRFSGDYATFNLTTGTVIDNSAGDSVNIKSLANNWYEISVVADGNANGHRFGIYLLDNSYTTGIPSSYSYTGDGTSGVYIFGAQVEQQSSATSYIPNFGTIEGVSRSADTANGSGNASTFNDSEGVLMVETAALANGENYMTISVNDGTASNHISLLYRAIANEVWMQSRGSGGTDTNLRIYDVVQNQNNKIALSYSSNGIKIFVNGVLKRSRVINDLPVGLNSVEFNNGAQSETFYGKTKQLQYFDTALTDAELETLTSYSSFNEMALAQNYIIQ